jgi:hypothetical protein
VMALIVQSKLTCGFKQDGQTLLKEGENIFKEALAPWDREFIGHLADAGFCVISERECPESSVTVSAANDDDGDDDELGDAPFVDVDAAGDGEEKAADDDEPQLQGVIPHEFEVAPPEPLPEPPRSSPAPAPDPKLDHEPKVEREPPAPPPPPSSAPATTSAIAPSPRMPLHSNKDRAGVYAMSSRPSPKRKGHRS